MKRTWQCTIPGSPVAQGRPRFARCGRGVRTYTPKRSADWRAYAVEHFERTSGGTYFNEPIAVRITAVVQRPKRILVASRTEHDVRPDADNFAKACLDALTKAGVIRDDCLVTDLSVRKLYAAANEEPHLEVLIVTIH